jgi:hypothetical protein
MCISSLAVVKDSICFDFPENGLRLELSMRYREHASLYNFRMFHLYLF